MEIRTVGVVGAGLMGAGIVEQAAKSGFDVVMREIDDETLAAGRKRVEASTAKAVEREKLSEEVREAALKRITGTTDLEEMAGCDLVVEAIVENLDAKQEVFRQLDRVTRSEAILTSNTSSVSITALAAATERPDKVAGAHFFNPVPVMKLVELVRGLQTSEGTMTTLREFGAALGKKVVVAKDTPGFIVNYLLVPYLLDAVRMVENGTATAEDIDTGITLGLNHPMGPITLLDYVGIDTTLYIADVMYEEFRDSKYAAPPLLRAMVRARFNGARKPGNGGFYDYLAGR
ncbi:MAG TPA: 3-hydroxybutyryl-CoA dehydrogenase [Chloroflexi bacterium]|nr:3-hydroxybutyryl-CoA dehydrogenase [Chloroflexota bacterium]